MKNEAINLLKTINREGINELINYLEDSGYFEAAASTKFHGSHKGGLLEHSMSLYRLFKKLCQVFKINITDETIIICSLLHDVCKIGAYDISAYGVSWNRNQPNGHALLSIERIEKYIHLTIQEKKIIKYHMGMYGTHEIGYKSEYSLSELNEAFRDGCCKLFYFCDDMSSQFLER